MKLTEPVMQDITAIKSTPAKLVQPAKQQGCLVLAASQVITNKRRSGSVTPRLEKCPVCTEAPILSVSGQVL